jgi:hypothetical protein
MGTWDTGDRSVNSLYGWVLGREGDQQGLDYWKGQFGDTVDDNELSIFGQAAVPELSTNIPSWMGPGTIRTGDSYYNTNTRTGYNPLFSGGGYNGENSYTDPSVSGYRSYTMTPDMMSGSEIDPRSYNGTQYTDYGLEGNQMGTGTYDWITNKNSGWEIAKIFATAAGVAGLQEAGIIGGTNPVLADPVTGLSSGAVSNGPTLSKAVLDGTNYFGANSMPGALDITALNAAAPGLESQLTLDNMVSNLNNIPIDDTFDPNVRQGPPGQPPVDNPIDDTFDPDVKQGPTNPIDDTFDPDVKQGPTNPIDDTFDPNVKPGVPVDPTKIPPIKPPGDDKKPGGGRGDISVEDFLSLLTGGLDAKRQGDASKEMLDWLKSRTAITDNLYQPGTPEYNTLWDQMSRKDAAAGRNSQYGPRSVDLASKIAQIKASENTKMTTGIGALYKDSINQNASKYSGLEAALGKLTKDGGGIEGITGATSLFDLISQIKESGGDLADWIGGLFD